MRCSFLYLPSFRWQGYICSQPSYRRPDLNRHVLDPKSRGLPITQHLYIMLAMGFEPTSSLLKRQVRQPLRYASACKNHSASAPHGCRTRLITIKSRVHDRSANGAKFYDSAFVSVFVSSSLSSLLSLYNCSNRDRTDNLSGMDRILSPVELCCSSRDRSRTCGLLINSQALYQLGYPGIFSFVDRVGIEPT